MHSVFSDTLDRRSEQVKGWVKSIETFQYTLEEGGLGKDDAWECVCVYIERLLNNIHDAKSSTAEGNEVSSMIWGSMRCHRLVEEYSKYNWIEHPLVGGYVGPGHAGETGQGQRCQNGRDSPRQGGQGDAKWSGIRAELSIMKWDINHCKDQHP